MTNCPSEMTHEELTKKMVAASSVVKLVTGIGNNAAWMIVLEALDHARQCRRYRGKVKHLFKRCIEMFHEYERRLIYAVENRMFHLEDMSPEVRKKYGNISDRQYYDLWAQTGVEAYKRTRAWQTSLWNKYRVSLVRHGVPEAEHVAWVMTAMAALELSVSLYNEAIRDSHVGMGLQESLLHMVFGQFSLQRICKTSMEALNALAPETDGYELDQTEHKNIEMGLKQLCESWIDTNTIFGCTLAAVEEYSEVFRTRGEQKKAIREIATVKNEADANL